jgi:hypothetical protein
MKTMNKYLIKMNTETFHSKDFTLKYQEEDSIKTIQIQTIELLLGKLDVMINLMKKG